MTLNLSEITMALCATMLTVASAVAQHQDGNAGGWVDQSQNQGEVYQGVVSGDCNSSGGACGSESDWNDDFYDCCRKSRFDFDICDPCCEKAYFSAFGGGNAVENFYREVVTGPDTVEQMGVNMVDGYVAGGAVGKRVHQHLRLETEYSYRFNKAETFFTATEVDELRTAYAEVDAVGRIYSHSGMFNALYDFSRRRIGCPNLYGGGGIGVLTINADVTAGGTNYVSDDSQFAYQFIAGVNIPTSQRIEWFGEYRFLGSQDIDVIDATAGTDFGDVDYHNHSVVFGLRLNR